MLDIRLFLKHFSAHVSACRSVDIICGSTAAFESWFRVEMIPVLGDLKIAKDSIGTNYTYPGSGNKADLYAKTTDGIIVFELKSFVSGQDAQKKGDYCRQIKSLEGLITTPAVTQVVGFATFQGYSELRMKNYLATFFQSPCWDLIGPTKLVEPYALFAAIGSLTKAGSSRDYPKAIGRSSNSPLENTPPNPVKNNATGSRSITTDPPFALADRIRDFVKREYIIPARQKNISKLTIRAGDVHSAMHLSGRMPAVCSAIGSKKFQETERLRLIAREGPREGSNVVFTFELLA